LLFFVIFATRKRDSDRGECLAFLDNPNIQASLREKITTAPLVDNHRRLAQENGPVSRLSLNGEPVSIASANGMKLGLFGQVHCLEDESQEELAELREQYRNEN
jgi:hypothetical protein